MTPAQDPTLIAAASVLLVASHRSNVAGIEGDGLGTFSGDALPHTGETFFNRLTELMKRGNF